MSKSGNTSGCSTAVNVGISSSATEASYISGGEAQNWATRGTSYTYTLSETAENKVYYIYVTKKNAQITEVELTYSNGKHTTDARDNVWIEIRQEFRRIFKDNNVGRLVQIEGEWIKLK